MGELADPLVELLQGLVSDRTAGSVSEGERLLVGLVGRGILSSRSPAMHEREAARLGIPCAYLLVDFDRLGLPDAALAAMIAAAGRVGFRGLNVTHPFKQAAVPHLDRLTPEVQAIGAVNTIVYGQGRTTGHNTDSWGFAESFRAAMQGATLGRVVQLGAGGAGAAVAHALLSLGTAELLLVDTDRARAQDLARRMPQTSGGRVTAASDLAAALASADGLVNTTPVGMDKYPGLPLAAALLQHRHWVADIVYFPVETELLRRARALGCRTLAGTGMAIGQAARAFTLFTGQAADRAAMAMHFAGSE